MACRITDYMKLDWVAADLKAHDKQTLLLEITTLICHAEPNVKFSELYHKLTEREQKASTGADHGVAIPHATIDSAVRMMVIFGRSRDGIPFNALDNEDSRLFFAVISPSQTRPDEASYLQLISSICRLMRSGSVREKLLNADSPHKILEILKKEEDLKLAQPLSLAP